METPRRSHRSNQDSLPELPRRCKTRQWGLGGFRPELAQKALVVGRDEFLDEAPLSIEPKDVHEVEDDSGTVGFQGSGA